MIYWHGRYYQITPTPYNGAVLGILLDGVLRESPPLGAIFKGHVTVPEGVILIYKRRWWVLYIVGAILLLSLLLLWPHKTQVYYQVTFAEQPLLQENMLYCNVLNESDIPVTVEFVGEDCVTQPYHLNPGDTLPYIPIDFIPDTIRYNCISDFTLEVRCV